MQKYGSNYKNIKLLFVGDMCLSYQNGNFFEHDNKNIKPTNTPGFQVKNGVDPFIEFKKIFDDSDVTIGNFESNISTQNLEGLDKDYVLKSDVQVVHLLKKYFSAVSIANNHSYDYGEDGFVEMLDILNRNKVTYFGGGYNIEDARKPLLYNIQNKRIAILSYDQSLKRIISEASHNKAGIVWGYSHYVKEDIEKAKNYHKADYIIIYVHWGSEYKKIANDEEQLFLSHFCIDCGADVVIGTHPHVTQNIEIYKNKPIFYSLGNFIFNGFYNIDRNLCDTECNYGWMLQLFLSPDTLELNWDIHIINLDQNGMPKYYGKLARNYVGTDFMLPNIDSEFAESMFVNHGIPKEKIYL
jgi:poly-gamma-glutamate synthesis protein (capsule biosynthesis protein)